MRNNSIAPDIYIRDAFLAFQHVVLFQDLNLTLSAGKWTCLLGPSGVGKSTLLRLIANLSAPETNSHANISTDTSVPLSQQIAYMAQTDLLLPWLNVLDNTLLGTRLRPYSASEAQAQKEKARKLLALAGLENSEKLFPRHLSGGMRQRTALVRTLMQDRPVILMDEPFSALDAITRYKLQNLAVELLRDRTVLLVTHDPLEALRLGNEIYVMSGRPAILRTPLKLNTSTPRDPASPEVIALQAKLFAELTHAHEACS